MYIKTHENLIVAYPYGISELMHDNPNTSFPAQIDDVFLARYGIHPVQTKALPHSFDSIRQNAISTLPVLTADGWVQAWHITSATDDEVMERVAELAQNALATRAELLRETDWAALVDTTLTPEMAVYRQALRDITAQADYPETINWPVAP